LLRNKGDRNASLHKPYESEQLCGNAMCIMQWNRLPRTISSAATDLVRHPRDEPPLPPHGRPTIIDPL
jgi:hypothetical protein